MRKTFKALLVLALLPSALAHEIVSFGSVSAEFHTDANEQLRANDETLVGVRLLVKGQEIDAARCKCQLLLYPGKPSARVMPQIINLEPGFDNPKAAEGWAKVAAEGPYTLVLAGQALNQADFDPFRVTYEVTAYADPFAPAKPAEAKPAEAKSAAAHATTHH